MQTILTVPNHRGEAALRRHLPEHDQKATLSSKIRKVEISIELANSGQRVGFESVTLQL